MVAIIYDTTTRQILGINPERRPDGTVIMPIGVSAGAVDIAPAEAAKFSQPGSFSLDPDGRTVTVTPAGPNPIENERAAAVSDLLANVGIGLARLDDMITNLPTYTAAQRLDAQIDMARMLRRSLRLLRALLT